MYAIWCSGFIWVFRWLKLQSEGHCLPTRPLLIQQQPAVLRNTEDHLPKYGLHEFDRCNVTLLLAVGVDGAGEHAVMLLERCSCCPCNCLFEQASVQLSMDTPLCILKTKQRQNSKYYGMYGLCLCCRSLWVCYAMQAADYLRDTKTMCKVLRRLCHTIIDMAGTSPLENRRLKASQVWQLWIFESFVSDFRSSKPCHLLPAGAGAHKKKQRKTIVNLAVPQASATATSADVHRPVR